jgi:N-acetylglucosaminyldiphosphoundecaprenol N-acetyl-beta-D-mannosaminyltransferase
MGYNEVGQVAGNELFHALLKESSTQGYTHYFYGSTPTTIELMKQRLTKEYPDVKLIGAISPPFQPVEEYDIDALAEEVNQLAPTFFWVGLGAPKQERIMALLQPKLKSTICIGVGLVFEYYAGTVKRAPKWTRKLGLEWLVRMIQQPRRFKMFIAPFVWTIKQIIESKL